jgi:hypothetical protein
MQEQGAWDTLRYRCGQSQKQQWHRTSLAASAISPPTRSAAALVHHQTPALNPGASTSTCKGPQEANRKVSIMQVCGTDNGVICCTHVLHLPVCWHNSCAAAAPCRLPRLRVRLWRPPAAPATLPLCSSWGQTGPSTTHRRGGPAGLKPKLSPLEALSCMFHVALHAVIALHTNLMPDISGRTCDPASQDVLLVD